MRRHYKKNKFEQTPKEGGSYEGKGDAHLQARKRPQRKTKPTDTLDFDF